MTGTRKPAVAGLFYPDDQRALQDQIRTLLAEVSTAGSVPKAIIAPHAGYIYSGPIAASAYARLKPARGAIKRVILLGPAHHLAFRGLAFPDVESLETPLGTLPVDLAAIAAISELPQIIQNDAAHVREHSLEVQLPFLQEVLGEIRIVPLAVSEATASEVGEVLERLWGGAETLIVISSDLSHYHDYRTAQHMDRITSQAIEQLRYEDIDFDHACGRIPISGLLYVARRHGLQAHTVDLRNSGDTAGAHDQVVGYGAYVFN